MSALLGQQLAANCVLRCDLAPRVTDGNGLRDWLTVIRVVYRVGRDDPSVLGERRVDLAHEPALVVVALHVTAPSVC
jgi:hypothetical protein